MNERKRKRLINLKVSDHEYDCIESLARKHSSGNISGWLRDRGMSIEGLQIVDDQDEDDSASTLDLENLA